MKNPAAIILVRTDSARLPNKAINTIYNKPLLEWVIDNLSNSTVYKLIVATSNRSIDDSIIEIAKRKKTDYFRGETDNVARRILDCCDYFNIDVFARINGDSPLISRKFIEDAFGIMRKGNYDFVTNLIPRAFPYGISAEILKTSIFKKEYKNFTDKKYQEHVTTYFYENNEKFNIFKIKYGKENHQNIRLVVDTKEDHKKMEVLLSQLPDINNTDLSQIIEIYNKQCNL